MPIRLVDAKHPRRYKHSLRKSPYFVSLIFLLAATTLTLLNIYIPDLIRVVVRSPGPVQFETQYGLYQRCTRTIEVDNDDAAFLMPSHPPNMTLYPEDLLLTRLPHNGSAGWECQDFPSRSECQEFGEKFCVLWSTGGYAAQLSLVPCLTSLFSLLFIFLHRGQRTARARARRQQWKLVSVSMAVHFVLQVLELALIGHVYRTDGRFDSPEASLHQSFLFGALSAVLSLIITALLTFTGIAARRGKPWAAGKSARHARRHRRTRSGQVIAVPDGTQIPPEEVVTVGELEAARNVADERTGLLEGQMASGAAGGSRQRATDNA